MNPEIYAAWITACAMVISASVGVAGVYAIVIHRATMLRLCKQVEAYHRHEGALVKQLLVAQRRADEITGEQLRAFRGQYRSEEFQKDEIRPEMAASEARRIRRRLLDFS